MAGHSSVMFDYSWCVTGVLGSQVFGQASMESCAVLATPYNPRLPAISSIVAKNWRTMTGQDSHLKEVFLEPPLTAYKRQQNLRGHLIRAKVSQYKRSSRIVKGMKKCGNQCTSCAYIKEGNKFKINGKEWKLNKAFNCKTYNCIYAIFCMKENCQQVYIGETKRMLQYRFAEHRGYVTQKVTDKSTGNHFNSPGHSLT